MYSNSELHHPTTLHTLIMPSIYSETKQKSDCTGGMINCHDPAHTTGWNRTRAVTLNTHTDALWSK